MKLLLVTASSSEIKHARRPRFLNFQQVTMPYLASFVPKDWKIEHIDEHVKPVDTDIQADLVAITFHTPSAYRAYEISKRFMARGITTVLGGPHVTLLPEEAKQHADAIIIGEAERTWPEFLRDFKGGNFKKIYSEETPPCLLGVPAAVKRFFVRRDHTAGALFASRGCPNNCEFCVIPVMYKNSFRKRPVSEVAAEYGSFRGKVLILWDDNISADPDYAKSLFKAISKYNKWWSAQCSAAAFEDDEFLELAAASGCKQLFIGLESVSQKSLDSSNKRFNRVEKYYDMIKKIHSFGIAVQAGIVFGFDCDTVGIFSETVSFLNVSGVDNATFNILTPYPGTPLFKRLEAEGRILTREWNRYDARTQVVYRPANMTPEELLAGFDRANSEFYSPGSIAARLSRSKTGLWWTLPLNLAYMYSLKKYRFEMTRFKRPETQ